MKRTVTDSMAKRLGVGVLCACGASLTICGMLPLLILKEVIPIGAAPSAAIFLNGAVIFAACYLAVRKCAKSRLPLSMLMAAAVAVIEVVCKAAFLPRAEFSLGWYSAVPFAASALAGVLASKKKTVRR